MMNAYCQPDRHPRRARRHPRRVDHSAQTAQDRQRTGSPLDRDPLARQRQQEAGKSTLVLFWSTIVLMLASIASVAVYHCPDATPEDLNHWYGQLTTALQSFGIMLGKLVVLAPASPSPSASFAGCACSLKCTCTTTCPNMSLRAGIATVLPMPVADASGSSVTSSSQERRAPGRDDSPLVLWLERSAWHWPWSPTLACRAHRRPRQCR
jgi:hypothetical protein